MEETVLSQVSKMLETSAAPEGDNLTPGSYPMGGMTETSVSSAIAVRSPLQVSTLTINFTEDREILNTDSIIQPLTVLLSYTPDLRTLSLRTPCTYGHHSSDRSLVGFRAPPLPRLEVVRLGSFRVDKYAVLSLLKGKECLREVSMDFLSLEEGEWVHIEKEARVDKAVRSVMGQIRQSRLVH